MPLTDSISPSLPPLITDYFSGSDKLRQFYDFEPTLKGLRKAAELRGQKSVDREVLVEVLNEQTEKSRSSSKKTLSQIQRLKEEDVFTITTGHQLCLFGGPMFFLYKIISVIKLSELLEEKGIHTVPIYWMASEDHDYEEINHIHLNGEKYTWESQQRGPVGRMTLEDLESFTAALKDHFADDPARLDTLSKLESFFNPKKTLAEGVRDLVYALFAEKGLVVIDADDRRLKKSFSEAIKEDVFNSASFKAVSESTEKLNSLGYSTQVSPREINMFWMESGYRDRIVKTNNGFATADEKHHWSNDEIDELLAQTPEFFSPNVVTRPLYQETILPNLAYIGGPGELSYWLQLKANFDRANVFFPVLILRDMAFVLQEKPFKRMNQLGLSAKDVYTAKDELFTALIRKEGTHEHLVTDTSEKVDALMSALIQNLKDFDPTMEESARAEHQRILNRLAVLRKKVLRSERKQNDIIERQLEEWLLAVRPCDAPQERITNWLELCTWDTVDGLIDELAEHFNPLDVQVKVLT